MRLVIGEDALLFREGLVRLLADTGFDVVATAADADDLVRKACAHRPEAVITDIRMPPTQTDEGLRAAAELGRRMPDLGVLVLSQYVETDYAVKLLEERSAGRGYLLKERVTDLGRFADAIRAVAAGGSVLDPAVVAQVVGRLRVDSPLDVLSRREREILALMAEGRSNQGIADQMFLTERTVESHVASIFRKLGLAPAPDDHRRVLAVLTHLRS